MDSGDNLIFGRFTREECGLPPTQNTGSSRRFIAARSFMLLAVLILAGWVAGVMTARWREMWVADLPAMVAGAAPEAIPGIMARGRMYATALPERPRMRRNLAIAALVASEGAPRRLGYYANARNLFLGLPEEYADSPAERFATELTAAGLHADLGDYDRAFAGLDRAEQALSALTDEGQRSSWRLNLINARAYFLAVAPDGQGRDPALALELAKLMMSSRDELPGGGHASDSAAFLDTFAAAWHAAGDAVRARATQTFALGLAETRGLDVYIRHYDEFADGGSPPSTENENGQ